MQHEPILSLIIISLLVGVPTSHAEQTVPLPNVEAWCTAFMFYKQQTYSSLVADFHFVVVKNAESYLQV